MSCTDSCTCAASTARTSLSLLKAAQRNAQAALRAANRASSMLGRAGPHRKSKKALRRGFKSEIQKLDG